MTLKLPHSWPALEILRALGLRVGLDFDGELLVDAGDDPARSIDRATIAEWVQRVENTRLQAALLHELHRERRRMLRVCYGGPLDQQFHGWCSYGQKFHGVRVERARWATYRVEEDGRAFFVGYATSEKKSKRGEVAER